MTREEAEGLVLFIKDHDTRFQPSVVENDDGAGVLLTAPDGQAGEPLRSLEAYAKEYVTAATPSIQAAWEKWRPGT